MKKYFILGLLILLFAVGCSKKHPIVGTWRGLSGAEGDEDRINTTFIFKPDGEMIYETELGLSKSGKYTIKDNEITMEISDIWLRERVYIFEIKNNKLTLDKTEIFDPIYIDLIKQK